MASGMIKSIAAGVAGGFGKGMAQVGEMGYRTSNIIDIREATAEMELEKGKRLADYKVKLDSETAAATRARASQYQSQLGTYAEQLRSTKPGASDTEIAQEVIKWGRKEGIPEEAIASYSSVAYPEAMDIGPGGAMVTPDLGAQPGTELQPDYVNPNKAPEIEAARIRARGEQATRLEEIRREHREELARIDAELASEKEGRKESEARSRAAAEARYKAKEGQVERLAEEIVKRRTDPPTQAKFGQGKIEWDAETNAMERELRRLETDLEGLADEMVQPRPARKTLPQSTPAPAPQSGLRSNTKDILDRVLKGE